MQLFVKRCPRCKLLAIRGAADWCSWLVRLPRAHPKSSAYICTRFPGRCIPLKVGKCPLVLLFPTVRSESKSSEKFGGLSLALHPQIYYLVGRRVQQGSCAAAPLVVVLPGTSALADRQSSSSASSLSTVCNSHNSPDHGFQHPFASACISICCPGRCISGISGQLLVGAFVLHRLFASNLP